MNEPVFASVRVIVRRVSSTTAWQATVRPAMSDIAANCSAVSPADTPISLSDDPSDLFTRIGKGWHTLPIKDDRTSECGRLARTARTAPARRAGFYLSTTCSLRILMRRPFTAGRVDELAHSLLGSPDSRELPSVVKSFIPDCLCLIAFKVLAPSFASILLARFTRSGLLAAHCALLTPPAKQQ